LRACHINHAGNKLEIGRATRHGGNCTDTRSPTNAAARIKRLCLDKGGGGGELQMISSLLTTKITLLRTIGGQQFAVKDPEYYTYSTPILLGTFELAGGCNASLDNVTGSSKC
jgi:hypothetical protein